MSTIDEKLVEIIKLAEPLNAATDAANKLIKRVNKTLAKANVGVTCEVTLTGYLGGRTLFYGRCDTSSGFALGIVSGSGVDELSNCSRQIKIAAVLSIGDMLDEISNKMTEFLEVVPLEDREQDAN